MCPLCYVSSYCTKQVLFWGEWGEQWKTLQWPSALQKLTISCGNTSFICQYKTIHDKTGVDQINAARFQKKIAINLNRIKYLWSLFPLTGFLFLASFPLSISPLSSWQQLTISYLTKSSGDYVNTKYMFCLFRTQDMISKIKHCLHFHWKNH